MKPIKEIKKKYTIKKKCIKKYNKKICIYSKLKPDRKNKDSTSRSNQNDEMETETFQCDPAQKCKSLKMNNIYLTSSSQKIFISDLYTLLKFYDACMLQIQIQTTCPYIIKNIYKDLLKITNIVIVYGTQIITECLKHDNEIIFQTNRIITEAEDKFINKTEANPEKCKFNGVYNIYITSATDADLVSASDICIKYMNLNHQKIFVNISKLSRPNILSSHHNIHEEYNKSLYSFKLITC
ncbi:putative glycoprotein [Murid herpesvirus 3]|uniref:Glycoprotein n=2 Tax=Murid betaherpesvirus 3 TaxID=2560603 RepID=A0A1P8VIY8_9BETA|nr:putative glycoprotein [Murine roseolovirus]APZ76316.1 putative glycoprotein [Murid betaherpesvirus 3]AYH64781.1 putative glycoprotein [Murid herpesvirus 3]